MAKPLGPKTILIREAIAAHPDKGNTDLAEMINSSDARKEDKIKVTAQEVASQKQAMKKSAAMPAKPAAKKASRKPVSAAVEVPAASVVAVPPVAVPAPPGPADVFPHIEAIKEAVRKLGADQVRRIVGLFE